MAIDFRLYLITDRKVATKPLPEAVRLALEGGVRAVQLREKDLPVRELLSLARELRAITREYGAKLFINDRVDVAVAVDADGVHLGHQSMLVEGARKVVGKDMLIGVSTHSIDEALAAQRGGADLITFGPVYEIPSKLQHGIPVGMDVMKKVNIEVDIPIYALGGVKRGNIRSLFGAGFYGVAMISAIFGVEDITHETRKMLDGIGLIEKIVCQECGRR